MREPARAGIGVTSVTPCVVIAARCLKLYLGLGVWRRLVSNAGYQSAGFRVNLLRRRESRPTLTISVVEELANRLEKSSNWSRFPTSLATTT